MNAQLFFRLLDVLEENVVPLTQEGVKIGCKVFGAAIVRKSDLSLVLAATNHEAFSPLWHGEVYAIKQFWELQKHPEPQDCIFLASHQPCCMCAAAIAWSGFPELYYLFSYEQTSSDFNIPHDQRMIRELFNCTAPAENSSYYTSRSLLTALDTMEPQDATKAGIRLQGLRATYAHLSTCYQGGTKNMVLR